MTQVPPPVQPIGQYPPAAASAQGSRAMAGSALALGICAVIPCAGLVTGIIGIILGIVALVKRKAGQGMAIAGIAAGAFGILVCQAIGVTILTPVVMMGLDSSKRTVCKSNVRMIGRSIEMYRGNHAKYPPDLAELVSEGFISKGGFRCPGVSKEAARSLRLKDGGEITSNYFYLPPPADADPGTMVLCDYKGNHKDGRTVLYGDGTVRFLKEGAFRSQLNLPKNAAFAEALRQAERP